MKNHSIVISSKQWGFSSLYLHYDNRCVYWFWTVFSGKRCGPWASCPAVQSALEKPNPRLFLQPLFDLGKFPFSYRCHMLTIFSLSSSTVLKWPEETALTFSEIPAQTRFLECFVTIVQFLLKAFFVGFDLIESTWSSILEKFGFFYCGSYSLNTNLIQWHEICKWMEITYLNSTSFFRGKLHKKENTLFFLKCFVYYIK